MVSCMWRVVPEQGPTVVLDWLASRLWRTGKAVILDCSAYTVMEETDMLVLGEKHFEVACLCLGADTVAQDPCMFVERVDRRTLV
jgi:hypothetical protein